VHHIKIIIRKSRCNKGCRKCWNSTYHDSSVVAISSTALHRIKTFMPINFIDDPEDELILFHQGDTDCEKRNARNKISSAVQWIDHPIVYFSQGSISSFFGNESCLR